MASERRRAGWLAGTRIALALMVLLVGSWFRTATPAGVDAAGIIPSAEPPGDTVVAVAAPAPSPTPTELPLAMADRTVPINAVWIDETGRSLAVQFVSATGCHHDELVVDERPDRVQLAIISTPRLTPDEGCRTTDLAPELTATLAEPLGIRDVVDAATGEAVAVGARP